MLSQEVTMVFNILFKTIFNYNQFSSHIQSHQL